MYDCQVWASRSTVEEDASNHLEFRTTAPPTAVLAAPYVGEVKSPFIDSNTWWEDASKEQALKLGDMIKFQVFGFST